MSLQRQAGSGQVSPELACQGIVSGMTFESVTGSSASVLLRSEWATDLVTKG
jgi:hypothetical protein